MPEAAVIVNKTDGCYREKLAFGMEVEIVTKRDQKTMTLTTGFIKRILTSKPYHSRGIKVMLQDWTVGRVQKIISPKTEIHE